jgi:hypothetical protein
MDELLDFSFAVVERIQEPTFSLFFQLIFFQQNVMRQSSYSIVSQ